MKKQIILLTLILQACGGGTGGGNGGAGGSGKVILRIPAAHYSGTTSGSPTVSDVGGDKLLVFNGSGSYTA